MRKWEKVGCRAVMGKRCELNEGEGRIADSGVSATEKSQKWGTVVIQQWRKVKSAEWWCFSMRIKSTVFISGVSTS
jgi:hypothetical protein